MKTIYLATLLAFTVASAYAGPDDKPKGPGGDKPRPDPAAMFAKVDTNSDGKISLEEFLASPRGKKDPVKAEEAFKRMDKDSDGSLTPEEMAPPKRPEGGPGGVKTPPPAGS